MDKRQSCPSKAALEEYVAGARLGTPHPAIEAHLATCKRCRALVEKITGEIEALNKLLHVVQFEPKTPCPADTVLAAYIDRALKPSERLDFEKHAAACTKPSVRMATLVSRRSTRCYARLAYESEVRPIRVPPRDNAAALRPPSLPAPRQEALGNGFVRPDRLVW